MLLFVLVAFLAFAAHDVSPRLLPQRASADSVKAGPLSAHRAELSAFLGRIESHFARLERAQDIAGFARRYRINSRLAHDIYDAAENAGLDPELAFRLVRVESDFDSRATSPVGAIGLTQVMLPTARDHDSTITVEELYDRRTNLRIGFTYLRALIRQFDGDVNVALAAYNRGPGRVAMLLAQGQRPRNDYERVIMSGYNGRGIME